MSSSAIRQEFRSFLPPSAGSDKFQFVPSAAGSDEETPERIFRALSDELAGSATPAQHDLLTHITPAQQVLLRGLTATVRTAWPDEIVPAAVESGQNGIFKVELKRVGKDHNPIPESGPQETRAFMYVDPTPGVDGMTIYNDFVNPAPSTRPLFAAHGVVNPQMDLCRPDHPLKAALFDYLDLSTRYVQADVAGDAAALKALEERAGDGPSPALEAAQTFLKTAQDRTVGDAPWITPVSVTDHGHGIYSVKLQQYFPSESLGKPVGQLGEEHGTLWIDTRPGLAGIETA